jgi:hypothetical protein
MSEVLLQSIVEKLEALEISLLKDNNPLKGDAIQALLQEVKSFQSQLAKFPLQFEKSTEKIDDLLTIITALNFRLANPIAEQIKHSHHIHKDFWIAITLFITCFLLAYGWMSSYQSSKMFKANDIKYRYLKMRGNNTIFNLCKYTDSLYQKDEVKFSAGVEQGEQNLIEQANRIRLADEKKKAPKKVKSGIGSK